MTLLRKSILSLPGHLGIGIGDVRKAPSSAGFGAPQKPSLGKNR
jgi:hypothetical protein